MLSWPPLRWLGIRSYGIYLWHWPVIAFACTLIGPAPPGRRHGLTRRDRIADRARRRCRGAGSRCRSCGTASASVLQRLQELTWPGPLPAARRSPLRALPVAIPVAVIVVACTAGIRGPAPGGRPMTLQQQIAAGARISAATRAGPAAPAAGHGPRRHRPGSRAGHGIARPPALPRHRTGRARPPHGEASAAALPQRPRCPVSSRIGRSGWRQASARHRHVRGKGSPRSATRSCSPPPPRLQAGAAGHLHRRAGQPPDERRPCRSARQPGATAAGCARSSSSALAPTGP